MAPSPSTPFSTTRICRQSTFGCTRNRNRVRVHFKAVSIWEVSSHFHKKQVGSKVKEIVAAISSDQAHLENSTQNRASQRMQHHIIARKFQHSKSPDITLFGAPACVNFLEGASDQSKVISAMPVVQNTRYTMTISNA